jgi:hypothetical protein
LPRELGATFWYEKVRARVDPSKCANTTPEAEESILHQPGRDLEDKSFFEVNQAAQEN